MTIQPHCHRLYNNDDAVNDDRPADEEGEEKIYYFFTFTVLLPGFYV